MKRLAWVATAVLVLGLGGLVQTRALAQEELAQAWEVRAGFFIPEKSSVRSAAGDIWLAVGAARNFWALQNTSASLSLEYYGAKSVYSVPIMVNVTQNVGRIRGSAGLGYAMQHAVGESTNALGYKLSVGMDLRKNAQQHPVYLDLTYRGSTQVHNDLNGFEMSVSYQF